MQSQAQPQPSDFPHRERVLGQVIAGKGATNGSKTMVTFEGRDYSYRQVDELSSRLANGLSAIGVVKGTHVALMLDNTPEFLWLFFALSKLGAVSIPINTACKGDLLTYYLNQSDSEVLVLSSHYFERLNVIRGDCTMLRSVVVFDEAQPNAPMPAESAADHISYRTLEHYPPVAPDTEVAFNDIAALMYTSGTTGPSKGNIFTHCNLLSAPYVRGQTFNYGPEDAMYICLPLFHGNGLFSGCISAVLADARIVLARRFSASRFWQDVRENGVTKFNLLSAMVDILWKQPPSPENNDGIRRQTTMVPVPDFGLAFADRFNLELTSVYSLSDYANATLLGPDHPKDKFRSAGKPRPQIDVSILDEDDFPVPAGEIGEICLRAKEPWIAAQGYYKMPEATLKSYRNLWFHTGDRGYLDSDGYLYFADRKKDAIRRRGENISAWEVERIVAMNAAIFEVAAYPVKAEMSEDEVMLSVVVRQGYALSEAAIIEHCRENMAYYMVPRFIEFIEELPKTMTQKVQKYKLQESAQGRLHLVWDREKAGIKVTR
jgi:crotonobetaine/carnitine-CoA ligase